MKKEWSDSGGVEGHSGDVRGRRWPPSGRQRGQGGMESDSPARLSGTYPVTLRLLLLHCMDDSVSLSPGHPLCSARESREEELKGQDLGVCLEVRLQGHVMTSDSFEAANVETGPGSDPGCPLECMCSAVR